MYWASDCYATPVPRGEDFVEALDPEAWREGFVSFQTWNSPWVSLVDHDRFAAACRRIEDLRPTAIASAHSPTIERGHVAQAFEMLRGLPAAAVPPQPGQPVLDQIVAAMAGADALTPATSSAA